jgi:hypothetical protein
MSDQTHSDDETEELTTKGFAVGANTYAGCNCPVREAVSSERTFDENDVPYTQSQATIIEQYDAIAKNKLMSEYEERGIISEAEARDVWEQLLKRLHKRYRSQTYSVAIRHAKKLGWNRLAEQVRADLEHQGSHSQ